MTIQQYHYTSSNGNTITFYPDSSENRRAVAKIYDEVVEPAGKMNSMHFIAMASGTVFFVVSCFLINCSTWQCYDNPPNDQKQWCQNYCRAEVLAPIEAISGILALSLTAIACCK